MGKYNVAVERRLDGASIQRGQGRGCVGGDER